MAAELRMPKLGMTMTEGTIIEWSVTPGTAVEEGLAVVTVSTDKVEAEVEAPAPGRLHPVAAPGETLPCGALLGWVLGDGETPPGQERHTTTVSAASAEAVVETATPTVHGDNAEGHSNGLSSRRRAVSPNARRLARQLGVDVSHVAGRGPGGRVISEDVERAAAATVSQSSPPPAPAAAGSVSYPAGTLAARLGIDTAEVVPSRPDGQVTREDVLGHARRLLEAARSPNGAGRTTPAGVTSDPGTSTVERIPLAGPRRVIAERMHASLAEMAQLTIGTDVPMDPVVRLRQQLQELASEGGIVPGYTDFLVAAAARALRDHPLLNSTLAGGDIHLLPDVHVGLAVAVPDGLVVPVIRHADRLPLAELAAEARRLADTAHHGRLRLADLEGATFSVTSLGMFDVDFFTPVINPPQAAILGVGRIRTMTSWDDRGRPIPVKVATLSLTWDHRITDGAPAARFLQEVSAHLQRPLALLNPEQRC